MHIIWENVKVATGFINHIYMYNLSSTTAAQTTRLQHLPGTNSSQNVREATHSYSSFASLEIYLL